MKYYYVLYNYKSALEAIASKISHSSMIISHPLLRVIILVLVLSAESVSDIIYKGMDLSPGGERSIPLSFRRRCS